MMSCCWKLSQACPSRSALNEHQPQERYAKDSPQLPSTHHQLWTTLDIAFFQRLIEVQRQLIKRS